MKTIIFLMLFLPSCAFVSKDIHPELTYREHPNVQITEHDSLWSLQKVCFKQHGAPVPYGGCSWVPHDPEGVCRINVMRGDKYRLEHELAHCHGYKDVILPWM